jgi:cellulose synthase operon protein C
VHSKEWPLLAQRVHGRPRAALVRAVSACLALGAAGLAPAQQSPVPEAIAPEPAVLESVRADFLTREERSDLRVRHGLYDDLDLDAPARRARIALERGRFGDSVFAEPGLDPALSLRALAHQGRDQEVVAATEGAARLPLLALRAQSLARLARRDEALALARDPRVAEALASGDTAEAVLAAVDLRALEIRLDAAASGEFESLFAALGRARDSIDRLDPAIRLREAQLLVERHARLEAAKALSETLSLSPRSAEAWYLLGGLALDGFDFVGAARAVAALRRIDPLHHLAAFLEARIRLRSDDPQGALESLAPVFARADLPREALGFRAAYEAARYDFDAMRTTLAETDARAPGSAETLVLVGRQLVFDRQYEEAREILERAAAREPAWAAPRAELGLLSMQDGREERALEDLRLAVRLDPHDERALFTLTLAEELAGWKRIETRHFVIRHPEGDAAIVAALLAETLDGMHEEVCARLRHEPSRKTIIDVMPDHRSFGVRVTGLPRIHTIAVCTGPTIAIEIPKEGARDKHLGLFDPLAVLRHEYTHTVTLSMTRNRIPHWLTEAVAVALEDTPRTFETCQLLAAAWRSETLFDLDEINWAFVRPRKPSDRAQAYAQGRWMVEYIEVRYGWDALCKLLFSYADGIGEGDALRRAFGVGRAEFFDGFRAWAAGEVRAWGLDPQPPLRALALELVAGDDAAENTMREGEARRLRAVAEAWAAAIGRPGSERFTLPRAAWPAKPMPPVQLDDASVRAFLAWHPEHPDLIEILLRRARGAAAAESEETREFLERYARARPVDPFPHRLWAQRALGRGGAGVENGADGELERDAERALRHLVELDLRADKDNSYALAIARLRRSQGDPAGASLSAERAVRMNPFDASVRELAAAIAIEAGEMRRARLHVSALVALEPTRELHRTRLERLDALIAAEE